MPSIHLGLVYILQESAILNMLQIYNERDRTLALPLGLKHMLYFRKIRSLL